jgi:hypothetical protein
MKLEIGTVVRVQTGWFGGGNKPIIETAKIVGYEANEYGETVAEFEVIETTEVGTAGDRYVLDLNRIKAVA